VTSSRSVATMSKTRLRVAAAASASVSNSMHTSGRAVCTSGTRVSRGVAMAGNGGDAGEDVAFLKQSPALLVRRGLLACAPEIEFFDALRHSCHFAVVEPVPGLVLVHDELGVREAAPPPSQDR